MIKQLISNPKRYKEYLEDLIRRRLNTLATLDEPKDMWKTQGRISELKNLLKDLDA